MQLERSFPSASAAGDIRVCFWLPDAGEPRGVLQITHGMAEHIERYEAFAAYLNRNGFAVIGQDHAGHGKSTPGSARGYFGESGGWKHLLADMHQVYRIAKEAYPQLPCVLMGHSMGSFLARSYAVRYKEDADAYIFSGTAGKNAMLPLARWLADRDIKKYGPRGTGEKFDKLAFGAYAKAIPDAKTPFDWLSRDEAIVNAYINDPQCGFIFTLGGFRDLFDGLLEIQQKSWPARTPHKPILIISGSDDPVGGKQAKGPRTLAQQLLASGHDAQCIIYAGGRHEMLNEPEKQKVYEDILSFMERKV